MDICLICVHRCHINHDVLPRGYSILDCQCGDEEFTNLDNMENNQIQTQKIKCNSVKSLDLPIHIKSFNFLDSNSMSYPSEEDLQGLIKVIILYNNI